MKPTHNLYFRHATTLWLLVSCLLLASCVQKPAKVSESERKAQDSIVSSVSRLDSLVALQKRMEHEGNLLGSIVAYRELGKRVRDDSQFDDALRFHSEGLTQAEALGDTLEVVQALNNIGTDYRRMGVLDLAQDYHYRAWTICREYSDTSYTARKSRVVSLNGLGTSISRWAITSGPIVRYGWHSRAKGSSTARWDRPSTMPTSVLSSAIGG